MAYGAGIADKGDIHSLSRYRFHDHLPIPFHRELRWTIDWTYEFKTDWAPNVVSLMNQIDEAAQAGGCWVDYATVFYWYQDSPVGYRHEERAVRLLRSSRIG